MFDPYRITAMFIDGHLIDKDPAPQPIQPQPSVQAIANSPRTTQPTASVTPSPTSEYTAPEFSTTRASQPDSSNQPSFTTSLGLPEPPSFSPWQSTPLSPAPSQAAVKNQPARSPSNKPVNEPGVVLTSKQQVAHPNQQVEPPPNHLQGRTTGAIANRPNTPALRVFSQSIVAPTSGSQLFSQRIAALNAGRLYTRVPSDSFRTRWSKATRQPTYEQWKNLLAQEARAVARGQGNNRLSILLGDSLSLWFPPTQLPGNEIWLNQGISGDTTRGILQRLSAFAKTRPQAIYIMAGINDLRRGASDYEILANLQQIMRQLRQTHPHAQIIVQSILPTRSLSIPNGRIWRLNQQLAAIAQQEQVSFLNLYTNFSDAEGKLSQDLTTDGLHLNPLGYATWQAALQQAENQVALR